MTQIPLVVRKLYEYMARHDNIRDGIKAFHNRTGLGTIFIMNILEMKQIKHNIAPMNALYDYFQVERDDFFKNNLKKWHQDPESIIGRIFRERRIQMNKQIHEVSLATKIDDRTIRRIECGESLPNFDSYSINRLVNYYDFSEQERHTIGWYITIMHDMMSLYRDIISNAMNSDDLGKK